MKVHVVVVVVVVLALSLAQATVLYGTITTLPDATDLIYAKINFTSGTVSNIAKWDTLGGGLGGHTLVNGPNGTLYMSAIDSVSLNNHMYQVLAATGTVLQNFTTPFVLNALQYSRANNVLITSSILQKQEVLASIDFSKPPYLTQRYVFSPNGLPPTVGLSASDPAGNNFYMYTQDNNDDGVFLVVVDLKTFSTVHRFPSQLAPVAMEFYGGSLLVMSWNVTGTQYQLFRVNLSSGSETSVALITPSYTSTLSASTVDGQGNFYFGIGNDAGTLWRIASVALNGVVTYSQPLTIAPLSFLPPRNM